MKKILLLTTAATIFSASTAFAKEGQFYVKTHAGLTALNKSKAVDDEQDQYINFKAKKNVLFGIGAGYYFTDKIRFDGVFDHSSNIKFTDAKIDDYYETYQLKTTISTIMANIYMDLFDINSAKIFAGSGLGIAMIKGKYDEATTNNDNTITDTYNFKNKTTFVYALHLGASTKITDNLHTDLTYSWRDYGKVQYKNSELTLKAPLKGHNVTLGLRYDI